VARHDAYICDVIVIPTDAAFDRLDELLASLKSHGLDVREVHEDQGYVEGTVSAAHIRKMEELDGVEYVRCVFSYVADFPEGDPRDVVAAAPT
jgi:hypothetical protein